jgi:hypothetical protein
MVEMLLRARASLDHVSSCSLSDGLVSYAGNILAAAVGLSALWSMSA